MQGARKAQGRSVYLIREGLSFLQHAKGVRSSKFEDSLTIHFTPQIAAFQRFELLSYVLELVKEEFFHFPAVFTQPDQLRFHDGKFFFELGIFVF